MLFNRLTLMLSPAPVRSRRSRAAVTASAPYSPAVRSLIGGPARKGGPSASPFRLMKPLMAWAMKSKAGRSRYGPLVPKPLMLQWTMSGFSSFSRPGPKPIFSMMSGRKFSITTSQVEIRRASTSLPAWLYMSSVIDFLLRL